MLLSSNRLSPDLRVISYADDTSVLFRVRKDFLAFDISRLNVYLEEILSYFDSLKLSINVNKTQVIAFRSNRACPSLVHAPILIRGSAIVLLPSVSCLGLTLDANLGWSSHVSSVRSRLLGVIAILHRLRRIGVPSATLLIILRALFEPLLSYCVPLWGSASPSTLRPLEVTQRNAFRAVFGMRYRDSVSHLFNVHKFLTLSKLYLFKMSCLAFRSVHGMLTPSLSTHFVDAPSPLRNDRHLNIPTQSNSANYLITSPVNQVISVWNSLSSELKSESHYGHFKSGLKDYVFRL